MDFDFIIYCSGKSGSSSLSDTFSKMGFNTFHVHNSLSYMMNIDNYKEVREISQTKTVEELIMKQNKNHVYIIDSYRTPFERIISSFFQSIDRFNIYHENAYQELDIDFINYLFYKNINFEDYHPLNEEYPIFNIVNPSDNYTIVENSKFTFIMLKFSKISEWSEILSKIFGFDIEISNENSAASKSYSSIYSNFKKKCKIPRSFFERKINEPIFSKYNTKSEIIDYVDFWKSHVVDDLYFEKLFSNLNFKRIPKDWNHKAYSEFNPDLAEFNGNEDELKIHYEFFGYAESRIYKY